MADVRRAVDPRDARAATLVAGFGVIVCFLFALSLAAGAGNCEAWYAVPKLCDSLKAGLPAAGAVALLPLLLVATWGRMLPVLLGIYVAIVPIDDALLVSGNLSVTKIVGVVVAIAAFVEMIRRRERISIPYAAFGWLALVTLMGLSLMWSINSEESLGNIVTISSAFALMVILAITPLTAAELRVVVVATILSGAAVGVVAIAMARHDVSDVAGQVGRLYLTFGSSVLDPNRFGASLLLPMAVTAGAFIKTRSWWIRAGLVVVFGLTFTAVYLSASRGTLVALAAMGVVAILYTKRRVILTAILGVGAALVFLIPSELSRRLSEGTASTGTGRTDIWRVGLAAIPNHWLLGSGQGTFVTAYNQSFFLAYQPQFLEWDRDPHNLIISTLVELGVMGLLLLILALIMQYRSVRLIPDDNEFAWLKPVFRATLVGLVVAAMFVDVLATKFSWLLFTEMLMFAAFAGRAALRPAPLRLADDTH